MAAVSGVVAAGVALGVGELVSGIGGAGPVARHGRRHAVHRPVRRVAEGPRCLPVRHERQGGADRRHRRRLPPARCRARPRRRRAACGSASSASPPSASSACCRTSTIRRARRASASSPRCSPSGPAWRRSSGCCGWLPRTVRRPGQVDDRAAGGTSRRTFLVTAGVLRRRRDRRRRARAAAAHHRRRRQRPAPDGAAAGRRRRRPSRRTPATPSIAGLSPYITPNADFYRIDTALSVAAGRRRVVGARHHGHGRPPVLDLTYDELLALDSVEDVVTLSVRLERGRRQPRRQRRLAGRAAGGRCSSGPACRPARRRSSGARSTASPPASRPRSRSTAARRWSPTR